MLEDFQEEQRKKAYKMRSVMDYTMGFLLLIVGIYFLIYEKVNLNLFNRQPSSVDYLIGALFILYGSWRIYRGYKKNYYK